MGAGETPSCDWCGRVFEGMGQAYKPGRGVEYHVYVSVGDLGGDSLRETRSCTTYLLCLLCFKAASPRFLVGLVSAYEPNRKTCCDESPECVHALRAVNRKA